MNEDELRNSKIDANGICLLHIIYFYILDILKLFIVNFYIFSAKISISTNWCL